MFYCNLCSFVYVKRIRTLGKTHEIKPPAEIPSNNNYLPTRLLVIIKFQFIAYIVYDFGFSNQQLLSYPLTLNSKLLLLLFKANSNSIFLLFYFILLFHFIFV